MFKILTLNNISPVGLDRFPRDRYEVGSEIAQPDAIIVRSQKMHDMPIPANLKAVARAGAGTNNIPIAQLTALGIPVFNTPGANANAVKELVIAGMLLAARNICQAWDYARQLKGDAGMIHHQVEAGKKQFAGFELRNRTLGVIGLGAIGVEVANAAIKLGMKVIGYEPQIMVQRAWQLSPEVQQAISLDELLMQADFISCHVPLTEQTRNLLNASRLALLKTGATVLNFSRGEIIDEELIREALDQQRLHAYICDFPGPVTNHHPRIIALPHIGASTEQAEENCAIMAAEQLKAYLEHGHIKNSVNFPDIIWPPAQGCRLAVVNSNVPDMVAKISHDLGKANINIIDMINRSRNEVAYTLLDLNSEVPLTVLRQIQQIEGVLAARLL